MKKKDNTCPACGAIPIFVSRDLFHKSSCANGHKWHTCVIHNEVNEDWPSINNLSKCTCTGTEKQEKVYNFNTKEVMNALSLMHNPEHWAYFEELRIGTGFGKDSEQRLDAWAIHYHPSKQNMVRCYEVKVSRSDFFSEIQKPIKRRAGLRLSNEFYFVAPKNMIQVHEVPVECGLLEVGENGAISTKIKAPYRNTIPPTFLFMSSLCRRADKERLNAYQELKEYLVTNQIHCNVAQYVIRDHIKKWKGYNQGNKEVPDQIAEALKQVMLDIEQESNKIKSSFSKI